MWAVFLLITFTFVFGIVALCFHVRRLEARRQMEAQAAAGAQQGLPVSTPAGPIDYPALHRVQALQADDRHQHVIVVGVPQPQRERDLASVSARVRQLPNGKLPTPPALISHLPTYEFSLPTSKPAAGDPSKQASGGSGADDSAAAAAADKEVALTVDATGSARTQASEDEESSRPMCVICCEPFEQGTTVKLLPCMHGFCSACIDAWLARDTHCPICKESVIRAAGMSEAEALEIVVAAQHTGEGASRDRQRQPRQQQPARPRPAAAVAPDLLLQAQQQRLMQYSRQRQLTATAALPARR